MSAELALLVGVPAVAVVGASAVGTGATPASAVPTKLAPNGGVQISKPASSSTGLQMIRGMVIGTANPRTSSKSAIPKTDIAWVAPQKPPSATNAIDTELQAKLDEINAYGAAAYDNLSAEAKAKGAAALNDQLKLDPPLSGDESWEDVAKIAGGAAGAAALGWLPGGQVLGPMVGAYLGVKLEELVSKNVDDIKAWFKGRWTDIESWVKGAAHDVEDAVSDTIDYIGGWF